MILDRSGDLIQYNALHWLLLIWLLLIVVIPLRADESPEVNPPKAAAENKPLLNEQFTADQLDPDVWELLP